ncbi:MAG: DUF1566 domain-containing protein [Nanobdellota archaeon]
MGPAPWDYEWASCTSDHIGQDGYDDGTAKSYTDQGDNVIKDDHTGLYWTKNESTSVNRSEMIPYCNNLNQGGYSDWRLPNIVEFTSVLGSDATMSSNLNPSPNGDTWASGNYWVSTVAEEDGDYYYVYLTEDSFSSSQGEFGCVDQSSDSAQKGVCVRGSTTGLSLTDTGKSFVDVGDGTVVDEDTGLVWQKGYSGSDDYWNNSVAYCNDLELAGYADWRLPTVSEGITYIDYDESNYESNVFITGSANYWTGTTEASAETHAYLFNSVNGRVRTDPKDEVDFGLNVRARCVRDPS